MDDRPLFAVFARFLLKGNTGGLLQLFHDRLRTASGRNELSAFHQHLGEKRFAALSNKGDSREIDDKGDRGRLVYSSPGSLQLFHPWSGQAAFERHSHGFWRGLLGYLQHGIGSLPFVSP